MSAARKEVAAKIKADNPTFVVQDFPVSAPEHIPAGKTVVHVWRESFSVNDANSQITHNLTAWVIVPKKGTAAAEDELDAAIDAVMLSLEAMRDVYWQEAQRTTVADKWEAYTVSLQAVRPQTYKSSVLTA